MAEILRLATAGSVDDGKSTLIGRLLYDSRSIFTDQLEAVRRVSLDRGATETDLALLTDGLRAEREQGITIDVAYRYFATPRRKFIVTDTPGHIQYTRNMVTGASTADVALILIDARKGVLEQSRRHAFIAGLLGIRHLVLCVNKMDLVDWSGDRFDEIRRDFRRFAMKLEVHDLTFIPISALLGDNVVDASTAMPWYQGATLLHHLEQVHIASDRNLVDARFPVQHVIRPQTAEGFRAYAGTIAGGVFKSGDEIMVLPSGLTTTIDSIHLPGGRRVDEAFPPRAVTMRFADELDVGRGDLVCRPNNHPVSSHNLDAMVCWLTDQSTLQPGTKFTLRHTTRTTTAHVERLEYRIDVNTLHRTEADALSSNEIGRIRLRTQQPLHFDPYHRNRATGSFILIDETTNNTVAAGVITRSQPDTAVVWHPKQVTREQRPSTGLTVWLTGLSGSGKSTVAAELERKLVAAGRHAYLLDGDNLRHGLNSDLGFSAEDRAENVRRAGAVAQLFADAGTIAIAALISPYEADRDQVRQAHTAAGLRFLEIFVDTPLDVCETRDPKGMYAKARAGKISDFTGVSAPYEVPATPDLALRPDDGSPSEMADLVLAAIHGSTF